jgi:hypothetical protein
MTYQFSLEDLKQEYREQLKVNQLYQRNCKAPSEIVDRMIETIKNSKFPSDWLRHNECLKRACKKFGITKSGELREFVKASLGVAE